MVYKNNYIACVKVNGQILRESSDGTVNLPWGSEYSLLLKNLNSVRATVKVSVDSVDATEGTSLIIPANGSVELERFIRNGNLGSGNKFKFIERTAGIEAHKGIGAEDGLVRVEYFGEVVRNVVDETVIRKHFYDEYYPVPRPYYPSDPWYPRRRWPYDPWWIGPICTSTSTGLGDDLKMSFSGRASGGLSGDSSIGGNQQTVNTANMNASNSAPTRSRGSGPSGSSGRIQAKAMRSLRSSASLGGNMLRSAALNNVGITVPGAESNQRFVPGQWFKTETTGHVIVLQLRGIIGGKPVTVPVTVKSKRKCDTCGKVNKPSEKFCGACGTALTVI